MEKINQQRQNVPIKKLFKHPNYDCVRNGTTFNYLKSSFEKFGFIVPPIITPNPKKVGCYLVLDGWNSKVKNLKGISDSIDCVVIENLKDEDMIRLIVDLNKTKNKCGEEKRIEFEFITGLYNSKRGIKGNNRAELIAAELDIDKERVRDLQTICNFFNRDLEGNGIIILNKVFGNDLSVNKANQLIKVVKKLPQRFTKKICFERLVNPDFDFRKLQAALEYFEIENEAEYKIIVKYLLGEITYEELVTYAEKIGKSREEVKNHNSAKALVPILTESYRSENAYIINEDNKLVLNKLPKDIKFKGIIGSPPYGIKRIYGEEKIAKKISGYEWAVEMADTYELFKYVLDPTGSIYVILDDYMTHKGNWECSIEHFVVEMCKRGFYLIGRYTWQKNNPIPNSHKSKKMVNGFEMIYRFVLDPENYYTNPNLFQEIELSNGLEFKIADGCTNPTKTATTRGGKFVQNKLKKSKNVFDSRICNDIIKSNVNNPDDYFRQENELKHTAGAPVELTACLILECTSNDDSDQYILDVWNGIGGTCESSLLLGKKYVGVELEQNYCNQTNRRIQYVESAINDYRQEFSNLNNAA